MKAADKRSYVAVVERASGVCEGCARDAAEQIHHRKYRSRGGGNNTANLIHLCHLCHGKAHTAEGEELGWSLPSGANPLGIPVRTWHRSGWGTERPEWALYDNQGGVHWITDEEAARRMGTVA